MGEDATAGLEDPVCLLERPPQLVGREVLNDVVSE
jgi:hypothetical protein